MLLLFNIVFAAVIHVALTRFETDKDVMDALLSFRKKKGAWGEGIATAGDTAPATSVWEIQYTGDATVVSQMS